MVLGSSCHSRRRELCESFRIQMRTVSLLKIYFVIFTTVSPSKHLIADYIEIILIFVSSPFLVGYRLGMMMVRSCATFHFPKPLKVRQIVFIRLPFLKT